MIRSLTIVLLLATAGVARADVELLDPDTALETVASSKGVVLVDLWAEW